MLRFMRVLVFLTIMLESTALSADYAEAEIKATFLYHFFHFIHWPEHGGSESRLRKFCSLDRGDVYQFLEKIVKSKKQTDESISIRVVNDIDMMRNCDYVFISGESKDLASSVTAALAGKPVLLVGDFLGFAEDGGTIEIYRKVDRVKVKINKNRLYENGLTASSELLKLATIINLHKSDTP